MAGDLTFDGMTRVSWVSTISSIAAPTVAELNAGTRLESLITPDGLNVPSSTTGIDNSSLASTFTTQQVGRRGFDGYGIMFKRKTNPAEDLAFTTLVYQASGYVVIRRDKAVTTAYASGDKVEVYPVQCGEHQYAQSAPNELQKFTVPLYVTDDPRTTSNLATVAP